MASESLIDSLPRSYSKFIQVPGQDDMTLTCMIGFVKGEYIMSTYPSNDITQRHVTKLDCIEDVEELIRTMESEPTDTDSTGGWIMNSKPKTTFKNSVTDKPLNRAERRALQKKIDKIRKNDLR